MQDKQGAVFFVASAIYILFTRVLNLSEVVLSYLVLFDAVERVQDRKRQKAFQPIIVQLHVELNHTHRPFCASDSVNILLSTGRAGVKERNTTVEILKC